MNGLIFDIQRFCLHDGPGIRTTVFMKGCPLRCLWCHNPESRSSDVQLAFYSTKCIACGSCASVCVNRGILAGDQRIDRTACRVCGECVRVCPPEALQLIGRGVSAAEVLEEVMRDQPFYETSGGGATLSGGEPLHQFEFCMSLLSAFKDAGLHTAVETSGFAPWSRLERVAELTDLFLYDLKVIDPDKHKRFCGVDNSLILENASALAGRGANVIFRTPVIPGCNDSDDDIRALGEFVLSLPGSQPIELMPYHAIGSGKYRALGMDYPLAETDAPDNLAECRQILRDMGAAVVASEY